MTDLELDHVPLDRRSTWAVSDSGTHTQQMEPITPEEEQMAFFPQISHGSISSSSTKLSDSDHSTQLRRSGYTVVLVLLWAVLAVTSWTLTCLLTHDPLTASHYGVDYSSETYSDGVTSVHNLYRRTETIFRFARTLQSVVSVLTIPLTSAVCSKAAVIFVQQRRQRLGFSMRQLMTLADRGWTDLDTIAKLIFGGWKRYGSALLLMAILLNVLGGVIAPIQQLFLSSATIKTPTSPQSVRQLVGIPDQFNSAGETTSSNFLTVVTRNAITSTTNTDPQPRLWTGDYSCNALNHTDRLTPVICGSGVVTLGNFSVLNNPYLAQLPYGYNTGLIKQFLPRFNWSVDWEYEPAEPMPADCARLPGSFFAHYANSTENSNWSIIACMPADQRISPWRNTMTRQDFSETLYLNISIVAFGKTDPDDPQANGGIYKLTVNTTAGYFELPNYMNGQQAGPLIEGNPNDYCGLDCAPQGYDNVSLYDHNITERSTPALINNETWTALSLDAVANKGPLLTVAMALFGDSSFIPNRLNNQQAYISNMSDQNPSNGMCIEQAPFVGLLSLPGKSVTFENDLSYCITNDSPSWYDVDQQIVDYIYGFYFNEWDGYGGERVRNAFQSAIFLANEAWLIGNPVNELCTWSISYDLGADTEIPVISKTGIIVVSTLLGLDIACLLALALYSAWTPRWTSQLDAFAMMRIGAAMSGKLPLRVAYGTEGTNVLDETSGFVGDATAGESEVGELGVGATVPLMRNRQYRSYGREGPEI